MVMRYNLIWLYYYFNILTGNGARTPRTEANTKLELFGAYLETMKRNFKGTFGV